MQGVRFRLFRASVLAVALTAAAGLSAGTAVAKKGSGKVNSTQVVNAPVPDSSAAGTGILTSTIEVGNKFKGTKIRDVNATVQFSGTGVDSVAGLFVLLQAPNGANATLIGGLSPGNFVGPLTLDDETEVILSGAPFNSPGLLTSPWVGTSQPSEPLAIMDNGRVKGNWTLHVLDYNSGDTNVLNSWNLTVRAGKPYETR